MSGSRRDRGNLDRCGKTTLFGYGTKKMKLQADSDSTSIGESTLADQDSGTESGELNTDRESDG